MCPDGSESGVTVVPFSVPGKVALWLEDKDRPVDLGAVGEDTIALEIRDSGGTRAFYIPGCASLPEWLGKRLRGAPLVLFDGTLWVNDEMIRSGVGVKTGQRMGHMSVSGADGTIAAFAASRWRARCLSTSTPPTRSCSRTAPNAPRPPRPDGRSPTTAWRSPYEHDRRPRRRKRARARRPGPDQADALVRPRRAAGRRDAGRGVRRGDETDRARALSQPPPVPKLLHTGELDHGQVQAWALNRYYYQASIPRKDLTLMARLESPDLRRACRSRVLDHDGVEVETGGISRYLQLTERLGLDRDYVVSTVGILPATRFAVDAYVHFVAERPPLEMIASSLTELFAPTIHKERIAGLSQHYDWADDYALAYFRKAPGRGDEGRRVRPRPCDSRGRHAREAGGGAQCHPLQDRCAVAQLDALYMAYVEPGLVPPGAFVPEGRAG